MEPWEERIDGAAVEISFEGFDADKRDVEEAREFVTAVKTPRDVSVWYAARWVPTSPTVTMLFVLGALLGSIADRIVASTPGGADLSFTSYAAVVFVAFLSPFLVGGLVARFRRPNPTIETGRFTLRLDAPGLSVTGASGVRTFPLGEIEGFEGGARLSVVKQDGTREVLPCSLVAASRHAALAARLDEALRSVRTAAGGYRGVRVAEEEGVRRAKQAEPEAEGEAAPGSHDRERHEES